MIYMEIKKDSKLKKLVTNSVVAVAIAGSLYLAGSAVLNRMNEYFISPDYFKNTEWCEINNPSGRIWTKYMNTNIPHNTSNWDLYSKEVAKKNKDNLVGKIYIPCIK